MLKPFLIVPALLLAGAPIFAQQAPAKSAEQAAPEFKVPAEYVNMTNPVKPTSESQARAKSIYGWDCAMCHGAKGDGKGDVAAEQKLTMRDYRDPSTLTHMTDGEIFYIIGNGKGKMPPEGDRAKPDEIWNLVIYLRKMAGQPVPPVAQAPTH